MSILYTITNLLLEENLTKDMCNQLKLSKSASLPSGFFLFLRKIYEAVHIKAAHRESQLISLDRDTDYPGFKLLNLQISEMNLAEFTYIVDLDEVVHNESTHLDLHCLPSSL